jgi:preprotein translocase subunit SecE
MWARMPVAVVGGIITVYSARAVMNWAAGPTQYIWGGIVFALLAVVSLYIAFFHRKTGEVLIETESEMRKVVWPTRDEVSGSTMVVIATTLILALVLYMSDVALAKFFRLIRFY